MAKGLDEEELVDLMGAEDYLMYPPVKGKIEIWIKCEEEMKVKIYTEDLIKILPTICPNVDVSLLLSYLTDGHITYVSNTKVKPIEFTNEVEYNVVPTLSQTLKAFNQMKRKQGSKKTPYGFSF